MDPDLGQPTNPTEPLMTPLDLLVVAGAIVAIVWVNWYFFLAGRRPSKGQVGQEVRREENS